MFHPSPTTTPRFFIKNGWIHAVSPLEPLSFHLSLFSSVRRDQVVRKLTSSEVTWARLHSRPLELSFQMLLERRDATVSLMLVCLVSGTRSSRMDFINHRWEIAVWGNLRGPERKCHCDHLWICLLSNFLATLPLTSYTWGESWTKLSLPLSLLNSLPC